MNFKDKRLWIGIVVVIVLIIVALWPRNYETICGPKDMNEFHTSLKDKYSPAYCDKSCNYDDDCQDTCGCGAININEICHLSDSEGNVGVLYNCALTGTVKCEDNKCINVR